MGFSIVLSQLHNNIEKSNLDLYLTPYIKSITNPNGLEENKNKKIFRRQYGKTSL